MSQLNLDEAAATFRKFCATVQAMRDPKSGCAWMIEQTHEGLRRYLLEEAYEAVEAVNSGDARKIADELGDVLLQVVLHGQIGAEQQTFTVIDAIKAIDAKMRRRHPHVFETSLGVQLSVSEVESRYDKIKAEENRKAGAAAKTERVFAGISKSYPALLQAFEIGKRAKKINFDWANPEQIFAHFESEVAELKAELKGGERNKAAIYEELSDVFFTLVQLTRHLQVDPETVALDGNRKFLERFALMEDIAAERGIDVRATTLEKLEALWLEAKRLQKTKTKNKK